jgi:hypothetical protein
VKKRYGEHCIGLENIMKVEAQIRKDVDPSFKYCSSIDTFDLTNNETSYKVRGYTQRFGKRTPVDVTYNKNMKMDYWELAGDQITFWPKTIGSIILGEKVIVSDPCYNRDVWCMTILNNIYPGKWEVTACIDKVNSWGKRCYMLELYHENQENKNIPEKDWIRDFELGVDSGTMSVIDDRYYRRLNGSTESFEGNEKAKEAFYQKAHRNNTAYANLFREKDSPVGAVCSSGIGDGSYPLYIYKGVDEKITALRISFL